MWRSLVLVLVVAAACGKKSDPNSDHVATVKSAFKARSLSEGRAACAAVTWEGLDETKGPGKELAALCKRDLIALEVQGLVEAMEDQRDTNKQADIGRLCLLTEVAIGKLDAEGRENAKEHIARNAVLCTRKSFADLGLPPNILAAVKEVEARLVEVDQHLKDKDPQMADVRCMVLIGALETLQTSPVREVKELWFKADQQCNLVVPVTTFEIAVRAAVKAIEAVPAEARITAKPPECDRKIVENAWMLLASTDRLAHDSVWPLVTKWNETCTSSVMSKDMR